MDFNKMKEFIGKTIKDGVKEATNEMLFRIADQTKTVSIDGTPKFIANKNEDKTISLYKFRGNGQSVENDIPLVTIMSL